MKGMLTFLWLVLSTPAVVAGASDGYLGYHRIISQAEERIANREFAQALALYDQAFRDREFVFRRDCQVAAQVAIHAGNAQAAFRYLRLGVRHGWEMKEIKKNKYVRKLTVQPGWKDFAGEYGLLRAQYRQRINPQLRTAVKKMFARDQRKALGALLAFGDGAQTRYAEKKFAPHSRKQLMQLDEIIKKYGYPGERLIGNSHWAATLLSHHNSISRAYAEQDTLYPYFRPELLRAIEAGQMAPYEFAFIDSWYLAVKGSPNGSSYGFLGAALTEATLPEANRLRSRIGMRSVETRNRLIDLQNETGMDFYLPGRPWVNGKIVINP